MRFAALHFCTTQSLKFAERAGGYIGPQMTANTWGVVQSATACTCNHLYKPPRVRAQCALCAAKADCAGHWNLCAAVQRCSIEEHPSAGTKLQAIMHRVHKTRESAKNACTSIPSGLASFLERRIFESFWTLFWS